MSDDVTEAAEPSPPKPPAAAGGFGKKRLIWIGVITALVWAFAINTGSTIFLIVVGVLTLILLGLLVFAWRVMAKQKKVVDLLQGSVASPEARRSALAKLSEGKDANSPVNLFARAQLQAADDPAGALKLLDSVELKVFPPQMQDDVSLLKVQLFLGLGRTADARKSADLINLDNPARKEIRPMASAIVAEAWARTGKSKEALKLIESIEYPKENRDQIELQARVARVFARFAAGQRGATRNELNALANSDPNHLGRFVMPQFRAHPELQKLARAVLQQHPSARQHVKGQAKR
ncbi:MAG: hypothetical protein ABI867_07390 [Kofleriaceae bacterium]